MLRRDDVGPPPTAYRARVATIDRTAPAGPERVGAVPSSTGWWREWFAPSDSPWPGRLDVIAAVAIAIVQVVGTILYSEHEPTRWEFDAGAALILLVGPVALLFRRLQPEATLVVSFAAAAGYAASGYPRGPAGFPAFAFALVSAIVLGRRRVAWGVLAVAFPAFVWLPTVVPDAVEAGRSVRQAVTNLAWLPLVAAGSEVVRVRLEQSAERERARRAEDRRRASEERLLIARELHDVLAHSISLINVQSGVALHLLDEQPERARPALEAINQASDVALGELRSVLDVLHRGLDRGRDGGGSSAWAPRAPVAGVRDLDDLVRRTQAAGLDVALAVEGDARPLPTEVDLAAFRIVQEALTNVVRHAGEGARATVRLMYGPTDLCVQVDDDGWGADPAPVGASSAAAADASGGRGIAGMRERVDALGGTFSATPRPGPGFRVRARFPLEDETR
jgi:signal transduction histidine kinase